jgi:hypothetical protein
VRGRTRPDPFIDVWADVQKLFEDHAGLEAKTVCGGPGCSDSFFGFLSGKVIQLAVVAVGM